MNVDSLAKILKMCDPSDSLKLWWRGGAGAVSFQCESGEKGRIADFVLKLMQVVSEHSFQRESGEEGRFADFKLKLMHVGSEHMEIPEQPCRAQDVVFDCCEKGLQVLSLDSSHVALVSLPLRGASSEFKCSRPSSLCMNVGSLTKILKMCGPSDSLKLWWRRGADTVSFQRENGEEGRIADFALKLMHVVSEQLPAQKRRGAPHCRLGAEALAFRAWAHGDPGVPGHVHQARLVGASAAERLRCA